MKKDNTDTQIARLLIAGKSERQIALQLRVGRGRVSRVKTLGQQTDLLPEPRNKTLEDFQPEILEWLETQKLTVQLIYERLGEKGIAASYATVNRFINKLKKQEVYIPLITAPGEEAQTDFGYFGEFDKNGKKVKVWVFVIVLSYSRYSFFKAVTDQSIPTFLKCHKEAFEYFKGVPLVIKTDNLKAGVLQSNLFEPLIQPQFKAFLKYYGSIPIPCKPRYPQEKGKVEAGVKFVKQNFLRGVSHRDFQKLEVDLANWNSKYCNQRIHGTTKKIPEKIFLKIEQCKLIPLPEEPYRFMVFEERTVSSYGHILFKENFYSVSHTYVGLIVHIESDGKFLRVYHHGNEIALHLLSNGYGEFISNKYHKPPGKEIKSFEDYASRFSVIGTHAVDLLDQIRGSQPRHWHKKASGILSLLENHSVSRVNSACQKALEIKSYHYKTVKIFCEVAPANTTEKTSNNRDGEFADDLSIYDRLINKK